MAVLAKQMGKAMEVNTNSIQITCLQDTVLIARFKQQATNKSRGIPN